MYIYIIYHYTCHIMLQYITHALCTLVCGIIYSVRVVLPLFCFSYAFRSSMYLEVYKPNELNVSVYVHKARLFIVKVYRNLVNT